ncbi:CU044_2847 family protein [Actinomycetota bacterium Odt1-20B]
MSELMRWESDDGPVVVEVDTRDPGFRSVSRRHPDGEIHDVQGRFEDALDSVRGAAEAALRAFRTTVLNPDEIELEFGVKLNAAAGAVIAKTSAEGHLTVKLSWTRSQGDGGEGASGVPVQGQQGGAQGE